MLARQGKRDFIRKLMEHGFSRDDSLRAYDATAAFFREAIDAGHTVIFQKIFKLEARRRAKRVFSDNLHGKKIFYGERIGHVFKHLGRKEPPSNPSISVHEIPPAPPQPKGKQPPLH